MTFKNLTAEIEFVFSDLLVDVGIVSLGINVFIYKYNILGSWRLQTYFFKDSHND